MRFLLKLNAAFFLVFMVGLAEPAFAVTEGKQSHFQRFKSGAGKFFGKAKTGAANKLLACGTNCANGKQSIQALVSCAYTHPRVPKCMRGMKKELTDLKKNFKETDQIDDDNADASKLFKTYFSLNRVSREMALQMASARIAHENEGAFKKGNLFILKRYYKKEILPRFFVPGGEYYDKMMQYIANHDAQHTHIGYLFHVDPVSVQQKGGKRMVHGVVLHTPTSLENHTGLIFEVPFDQMKDSLANPVGKFVYFSRLKGEAKQKTFGFKVKSRLGTTTHKISVNGSISPSSSVRELDDKKDEASPPPVTRHLKPGNQAASRWDEQVEEGSKRVTHRQHQWDSSSVRGGDVVSHHPSLEGLRKRITSGGT